MEDDPEDLVDGLNEEWPPGRWGFYVYLGYSNANAELYNQNETVTTLPNAFDRVIARKLEKSIESSIYKRFEDEDAYQIMSALQLDYIRLPSSRPYEAREHFNNTVLPPRDKATERKLGEYRQSENHGLRYQIFLLIDDECVASILRCAPGVPNNPIQIPQNRIAKACWADYDNEPIVTAGSIRGNVPGPVMHPGYVTFYGYMRVRTQHLWRLWMDVKLAGVQGVLHDTTLYKEEGEVLSDFYY